MRTGRWAAAGLALLAALGCGDEGPRELRGRDDQTSPVLTRLRPADGRIAAGSRDAIILSFSETLDVETVSSRSFRLDGDAPPDYEVAWDPREDEVWLLPSDRWPAQEAAWTLTVDGVRDRAGRPLAMPRSFDITLASP